MHNEAASSPHAPAVERKRGKRLPVSQRAGPGLAHQEDRREILRGLSILIVEADPASARLMSVLLSNQGCTVRVVGSAEEALALIPAFRPRIAVLDLVLPRMSGLLLARQLKTAQSTRDIPLVAVSFADELRIERVAREAGCAAYLPKPIGGGTFVQTLANLLTKE